LEKRKKRYIQCRFLFSSAFEEDSHQKSSGKLPKLGKSPLLLDFFERKILYIFPILTIFAKMLKLVLTLQVKWV